MAIKFLGAHYTQPNTGLTVLLFMRVRSQRGRWSMFILKRVIDSHQVL